MRLPLFPRSQKLEGIWWHKFAEDLSVIIFSFSILISATLAGLYFSQVNDLQKIKSISENLEISTVIKLQPYQEALTLDDLGKEIKLQNPQYAEVENRDLAKAAMYKYPSYQKYVKNPETFITPNNYLLIYIPIVLAIGFFLPNFVYRLILQSIT